MPTQIDDDKVINSLWIGRELSAMEQLTICSFVDRGYHFRLWVYGTISSPLPQGVELSDAGEILPADSIFAYTDENKYGHGKGSVAGFSDVFRYKLLFEKGGWWVDMDVTCLREFDFRQPYYFRQHNKFPMVGNVMKCPARSDLMRLCYEESIKTIDASNTDWDKPIRILNKHVVGLDLSGYIQGGQSNHDSWQETSAYIFTSRDVPAGWYFIHWQNEEWRHRQISKTEFYQKSFLAKMLNRYKLLSESMTTDRGQAIVWRYFIRNPYTFLLSFFGL